MKARAPLPYTTTLDTKNQVLHYVCYYSYNRRTVTPASLLRGARDRFGVLRGEPC